MYVVVKKVGVKEVFVFKTRSRDNAYQVAEELSNKGWICVIRFYP